MKRLFALLLALILVVFSFAACTDKDDTSKKDDETKAETQGETKDESSGGDTTDIPYETPVVVEGGTLKLQTKTEGDTLYVSVIMEGNPGFAGFAGLEIHYDNTKCVARGFTASELIDHEAIVSNIMQTADKSSYTFATAMWVNTTDVSGDGILYTLAFDIVDASAEDFGLKLTCDSNAFSNQKLEELLFTVVE